MSSSKSKKPRLYSDSEEEEDDKKSSKSSVFQRLGSAKSSSVTDVIENPKHGSSSVRSDRTPDREYKKDYAHESRARDHDKGYDKEGKGRSKDYFERSHDKSRERDYERSREYGREKDRYYHKDRDYEKDKYYERGRSRQYTSGSTHSRYDKFPIKKDSDKKEPCKFLFRNDFCNYGENCIFYHDRDRYEREFPHARSDRDKHEAKDSRGGYSKHHSERDHRSKDSWYKSDHSQDRERGYSSSPERDDSAEKPVKSTISSAPKQETYSSEESESDTDDLKTLEEKLQRYKEMASKQTTISVKKSGPRTPPERTPTPEPKGKVVKKKVKKKSQGSEETVSKKKKKTESGKKKVKRGSSLESSSHVDAVPPVPRKAPADGEKKKKKVKTSGEKGKSSTKTVKKKVKVKTEKPKVDAVVAAPYEKGEEVDKDREDRSVKSVEKKRIKSRSYSSSSSSSGSSRSRSPSYDEPPTTRKSSAAERRPKAKDAYSRSPSVEDSRDRKTKRGKRGHSHETSSKEEKRHEEEPKYRSDTDEEEDYQESLHYKEDKSDNSRYRHDSNDDSKYKHMSKSDMKYRSEKRDDSKHRKEPDYKDDSKYPEERRRHEESKYRDGGKYYEDGKYADESKYRHDPKYRGDDYKYKDDKYRDDSRHESKYGKDEKTKGYRETRRDDDDRKVIKKDYGGKDDRRDYSSSRKDDRIDDSRSRRDDERYERRDDRYRYDDSDKRDRQSDRGKERDDKYGAPGERSLARPLHHDKGDRSRHPSPPGNRLSPIAIHTRSRSPADRRIASPSYRRPAYPDYAGQRDRPPIPAPADFYDRNRPPPFYNTPDTAYRGRGREGPYPDRRADGLPYDRYSGPPPGPTDHYGGPPPPHIDDRYRPPDGRGEYGDFFRGRGHGRGLGRGRGGYGYEGPPRDGHYEEGGYRDYGRERRYKRDRSIGSDRQTSPDRKRRRDESDKRGSSREGRDGGDYSRSPRSERPRRDTDEPDSRKSQPKERKVSETLSAKDAADVTTKTVEGFEQEVDEEFMEEKEQVPVTDVVGILDIDWKSLMSSSKPAVAASSDALDRFTPANLLRQLGVSREYAGADAVAKVEELTGEQLKDDLAMIHMKKKKEEQQRKDIFTRIGPNRKALCARYDLAMRRQLNYLSPNESAVVLDPVTSVDKELVKQSIQLLTGKAPELVGAAS